jgi:membrane protein YqaA with SNARE-associated domain
MTDFFYSIFGFFLTPWGLVLLSALDLSVLFFVPFAVDIALIVLVARSDTFFFVYPLLATGGSLAGAALTFWVGRMGGEAALRRFVSTQRIKRLKDRVRQRGAVAMALPAVIPPPFPFKVFVLASGALDVSRPVFFSTMAIVRLIRFSGEAALAHLYGDRILVWLESDIFQHVVGGFILIAMVGTGFSIYRIATDRPVVPGTKKRGTSGKR